MWMGCERCQADAGHCDDCAVGYLLGSSSTGTVAGPDGSIGRYIPAAPAWLPVAPTKLTPYAGDCSRCTAGQGCEAADPGDGWLHAVLSEGVGLETDSWVRADPDELAAVEMLAAAGIVSAPRYGSRAAQLPAAEDRLAG